MFGLPNGVAFAAALLLPCAALHASDIGGGPIPKKLIAAGWDSPTPAKLAENFPEMEKLPFDGTRVMIEAKDEEGKRVAFRSMFTNVPWKEAWFAGDLADLKKVRSKKLTDNFLSVGPAGGVDWFDDEGWAIILEHARIGARLAKEGGLKGWMFDAEIGIAQPAFNYTRQKNKESYTFEQYSAQARKRGRQMMEVLAKEYPDMTLFTLFLNSGTVLGSLGADPLPMLSTARGYSLFPAFVNGWLDAIPPTMTIIDGAEYSYPHTDEAQYLKHVNAVRNTSIAYIAPENRVKFRSQVEAALAIYLDAYVGFPLENVHSDVFNDPPLREGERLADRLQSAVSSAGQISDRYVWLWGEHFRWWPTDFKRVNPQTWEAILPGITDALRDGMDPEQAALARADREFAITERKLQLRGRKPKNLIVGGGFAKDEAWEPADAFLWDERFGYRASGAARLEGGRPGVLAREVEVAPLRFYRFQVRLRKMGEGEANARLQWLAEDGSALGEPLSVKPRYDPRDAWQPATATVRAPAGAARLRVELAATGQKSPDDVTWVDDVELFTISVN